MLSSQIEARLRLAAPDEPSHLPPLTLPQPNVRPQAPWQLTLGRRIGPTHMDVRLALIAALLAIGAVAAFLGGALSERVPVDTFRFEGNGFTLEWPGTWTQLVSGGDLWLENGTEPSLLAAQVLTIASSRALAGCADVTPAPTVPGPVPTGAPRPSGGPSVPQPDAMMMCVRTAELPPDAVRFTVLTGQVPDLFSSPGPLNEVDWTETIDGYAALLVVDGPDEARAPGVDEIRTWLVAVPTSVGSVIRLRAELSGPNLAAGRAAAADIIESFRFSRPIMSLDLLSRDVAVETGLIAIRDRLLTENGSDFFACFPTTNGSQDAVLENARSAPWPSQ